MYWTCPYLTCPSSKENGWHWITSPWRKHSRGHTQHILQTDLSNKAAGHQGEIWFQWSMHLVTELLSCEDAVTVVTIPSVVSLASWDQGHPFNRYLCTRALGVCKVEVLLAVFYFLWDSRKTKSVLLKTSFDCVLFFWNLLGFALFEWSKWCRCMCVFVLKTCLDVGCLIL